MNRVLVVSNYNSNCEWVKKYNYKYHIYDRSDNDDFVFDKNNTTKVRNVGHNIKDYCDYFYDNYDNLPDIVCLLKGNMFIQNPENKEEWAAYKYITRDKFNHTIGNDYYTFLSSWSHEDCFMNFISCEGGLLERNSKRLMEWIRRDQKSPVPKHFSSYNSLLRFLFADPPIPEYLHFSPGACYVIPKNNISKHSRNFWKNITKIIDYNNNPIESHFLERMFHTFFSASYKVQEYTADLDLFDKALLKLKEV